MLADGLEITTLHFSPGSDELTEPLVTTPNVNIIYRKKILSQSVGKVGADGAFEFSSIGAIVSSIGSLLEEGAKYTYGWPAQMIYNPQIFIDYLDQEIKERIPDGDVTTAETGMWSFGSGPIRDDSAALKKPNLDFLKNLGHGANFTLRTEGTDINVYSHEAGIYTDSFKGSTKFLSLMKLFSLAGISLTRGDIAIPTTGSHTLAEDLAERKRLGEEAAARGASAPDADAAATTMLPPAPPGPPPADVELLINLSLDSQEGTQVFANVLRKIYNVLRSNKSDFEYELTNTSTWATAGTQLVQIQPIVYVQNDIAILENLINEGIISDAYRGTPVVFLGDVVSIIDLLGVAGGAAPAIDYLTMGSEDFALLTDDAKDLLAPGVGVIDPLILESSKNIVSFQSTQREPAQRFFGNNVFWETMKDEVNSEEDYKKFIATYLRQEVEKYGSTTSKNPFSADNIGFYDYEGYAEKLYARISGADPSAVGDIFIKTPSNTTGLLTWLYWYFSYVVKGTVLATATTLPYFKYSSVSRVMHTDVLVRILRNPSTYDHLMDTPFNNYNSGQYTMVGAKHVITNSQCISTFALKKISLGI